MQLFVLGMHRSGTSSVTRLLNMAGAYFGPEGISNGADEANPKGYWERRDVRDACDGLLRDSGFDWWKLSAFSLDAISSDVHTRYVGDLDRIRLELDAHRPWVVKEPRLSLLFPLLRPRLELPVCIHVTREPLEVAQSLAVRNGFPLAAGVALWEVYTLHGFRASVGLRRVHVRYEDLVRDPIGTTTLLIGQLADMDVHGLRVPADAEVAAFITRDLHRQHRAADGRPAVLNHQQSELAAAVDRGTILDEEALPDGVSEGAVGALRMFEELRALTAASDRVDELSHVVDDLRATATARDHDVKRLEGRLRRQDAETRRRLDEIDIALDRAQGRLAALKRSRTWRASDTLAKTRRRLTSARSGGGRNALDRLAGDIATARATVAGQPVGPGTDPSLSRLPPATPARPSNGRARPRIAVLAWDVGHNPLGRAHTLAGLLAARYEVEIWGAQFDRYGSEVWPPLRDSTMPLRTFPAKAMADYVPTMRRIAQEIQADAIYVSKPRFPSFGLGILAKEVRNRPLVLDVDDDELAFFGETATLEPHDLIRLRATEDADAPYGPLWTRAAASLIGEADGLTVSNVPLQERYGGIVVPHARDARVFDPDRYDRDETRRRLGIDPDTRLLLFGGTPRGHKGLVDVLEALDALGDDRFRLLLFATREWNALSRELSDLARWVVTVPYVSFSNLPPLVGAADLACVLQDPTHPASRFQLPAKVTDALAMRVPCLVRTVEPLVPLVDAGAVYPWDGEEPLADRIAQIFADDEANDRARRARKIFEEEYSFDAACDAVAPLFDQLLEDPPRLTARLASVTEVAKRLYGADHERVPVVPRQAARSTTSTRRIRRGDAYDVVMFWKQNDSGLYGRRSDMLAKYLERSERVNTIVHFDRAISVDKLYNDYRRSRRNDDQTRLVVRQTLRRALRRSDSGSVHRYTFVYGGDRATRVGLKPQSYYADHVRRALRRHGFGTRPVILWGFPVIDDLPMLIDVVDPDLVVTDVVDDHRTFPTDDARLSAFERNYREVLARSDVVFTNCRSVADSMRDFGARPHVLQNGLELRTGGRAPRPRELLDLDGPIIGYVGNLSHRLDLELLETVVDARPEWQFVFVGSAHHDTSVLRLDRWRNTHFVGPRPYDQALAFVDNFEVALIPHVDNAMTRSMNPLKAFVYCAAGVPVVSTSVANLAELGSMITVADQADDFLAAIESALREGRRDPDDEALRPHSWDTRVEQALAVIDEVVTGRH